MFEPNVSARHSDILSGPDVAQHVVRGGLQRAFGFVAVNLITAVAAVVLLRHLGVADFGRYGTVIALLAIVQGLSDAGLSMGGAKELAMRTDDAARRELLSHLLGLRIILTGVGIVCAVLFAIAAGYGPTLVAGTALGGLGVFLLSVQASVLLPLTVELQNGRLTINELLRQVVLVAAFIALVVVGATLIWFFMAQFIAAAIAAAATPLLLRRKWLVLPQWDYAQLRALIRTSFPLAVAAILGVLYFRIMVILMSLLEDSETEIGLFVTSARIVEIFVGLPMVLIGVVLPVMTVAARDDEGRLNYVTLRLTQTLALLGMLIVLVLTTAARPIILVLGGSEYSSAAPVLQIQSLALLTIFVTAAFATTLVGIGKSRPLAIGTAVGLISALALGSVFIPLMGADGAAIAAVLADVILCGSLYWALHTCGPAYRLPIAPFARIIVSAIPVALVIALSPLPDVANAVIAGMGFLGTAAALGAIPSELTDRIKVTRARPSVTR